MGFGNLRCRGLYLYPLSHLPCPALELIFFYFKLFSFLSFCFLPSIKRAELTTWPDCWGVWQSFIHTDQRYLSSQTSRGNASSLIPVQYQKLHLNSSLCLQQDSQWDSQRWLPKASPGMGSTMPRRRCHHLLGKRAHCAPAQVSGYHGGGLWREHSFFHKPSIKHLLCWKLFWTFGIP